MSTGTGIEWTDATWNPTAGCSLVSPGCTNCYAMKMAGRLEAMGQKKYVGLTKKVNGKTVWTGQMNLDADALAAPLSWKKPRKVFVNSMSDLFHDDVPFDFVDKVFAVMALCPQHTFQVPTKRPERMAEYLRDTDERGDAIADAAAEYDDKFSEHGGWNINLETPLPNVWLGTSVENQKAADERIPHLLRCPAAVRFLSCEPLLSSIDLRYLDSNPTRDCLGGWMAATDAYPEGANSVPIDWVIVGGESGHGARPMHPDWARSIRDQCSDAGVPYFFKQWGEFVRDDRDCTGEYSEDFWLKSDGCKVGPTDSVPSGAAPMVRVGKKAAGRLLDGRTWDEFPPPSREARHE